MIAPAKEDKIIPERLFFTSPTPPEEPSHRLSYLQWGEPAAPPILCMHGLTRNGRDFDILARTLASKHRLACPDMAGRGRSDWLANKQLYHYGTYLADTLALLKHLQWQRVGWIGTSMGGILGMMAAATQPGLLRWLVLNDIGMTIPAAGLKRITDYAGNMRDYATRAEAEAELRRIGQSFGHRTDEQWRHYIDATLEEHAGRFRFACDPDILLPLKQQSEQFQKLEDVDLSGFWKAVECPVLLLRGAESDILTRETAQMMAAQPNVTLLEFEQVGHAPSLLTEEQVTAVHDWIARQPSTE